MPKGKIHRIISKIRTGNDFAALHAWMDEDEENLGVNHRKNRHFYTDELRQYVSAHFGGPKAVSEWLFHIALDNLDTSVNNDWNFAEGETNFYRFGFSDDGFIYYDDEALDPSTLADEFSDAYEEEC